MDWTFLFGVMEDGRSVTLPLIAQQFKGLKEIYNSASRAATHGTSNYRPEIPSKISPGYCLVCFFLVQYLLTALIN